MGTAATTTHDTTDRGSESRFMFGLLIDVANVLEAHGYDRFDGRRLVELQPHLLPPPARSHRPLRRSHHRPVRGGGSMSFDTTPGDGPALLRALHLHHQRELSEAVEPWHRHWLVTAAGIGPEQLSRQGQFTLAWLCGWDDRLSMASGDW